MAYRTIRRAAKKYNVSNKAFVNVRTGQFGMASYHFVNEEKAYVSFAHELCSMWRLDDGSPMPSKKFFEEVSYDRQQRIFRGVVDWKPTSFCGDQRWEHEMVFDEDFEAIIDGYVHHFTPDVSDRHSKEQVLYYKGIPDDSANVLRYGRFNSHGDSSSTASPVDMDERQWEDLEEMIETPMRVKNGSMSSASSCSFGSGKESPVKEACSGYKLEFEEVDIGLITRKDKIAASLDHPSPPVGNELNCGVCDARVGKRFLNPRHHCRDCGICVCSKCSPHSIRLPGKHGFQRVCTPCMQKHKEETMEESRLMRRRRLSTCSTSSKLESCLEADTAEPSSISVFEDSDAASSASLNEETFPFCAVCECRLGKRYLNPRHHCKVCHKPVCSGCSPNSVVLPGSKGLQRVCTPCLTLTVQQQVRSPRHSPSSSFSSPSSSQLPFYEEPQYTLEEHDPIPLQEDDDSYLIKELPVEPQPVENQHCCAACGVRLGRRYFRIAHRCRICSKAVCSECSPSSVVLPDMEGPQRVCTPCIALPIT